MARVAANGGGRVTTVDRYRFGHWDPEETVAKAGLTEYVEFVREDYKLLHLVAQAADPAALDPEGNCEPLFDFCFLDGPTTGTSTGSPSCLSSGCSSEARGWCSTTITGPNESGTVPSYLPLSDGSARPPDRRGLRTSWSVPIPTSTRSASWMTPWPGHARATAASSGARLTTHRSDILVKRLKMAARRLRARR